jgi:hypothetical protein
MSKAKVGQWLRGLGGTVGALVMVTGCQTWYGGMTLPSGRYLQHYPQYFAPDPAHPLPRELASMATAEDIAGGGPRQGGGAAPAPAPPPAPVPAPAPAPKQ